ncbi:hypothetical protein E2C01_038660 [Portunus trituberculatus]|uniref:Secreted protein n=1 Tax=Portunus trituberculatus TaxID=210409 RepID=A0A5B7FJ44_PORTR|nr:hypothetical protein [Portunus trituberculatus]
MTPIAKFHFVLVAAIEVLISGRVGGRQVYYRARWGTGVRKKNIKIKMNDKKCYPALQVESTQHSAPRESVRTEAASPLHHMFTKATPRNPSHNTSKAKEMGNI